MEQIFEEFYENPTVEKLEEYLEACILTNENLKQFLEEYARFILE